MGVKKILTMVLIYISLITTDVDYSIMYLLFMCLFCKKPIHMFCPLLYWVFVLCSSIVELFICSRYNFFICVYCEYLFLGYNCLLT